MGLQATSRLCAMIAVSSMLPDLAASDTRPAGSSSGNPA
jgi:hypothetical protein